MTRTSLVSADIPIVPQKTEPILSKRQFVAEYEKGTFGNRAPTWNTINEWITGSIGYQLFHIRNRVAGGETWYDIPLNKVLPVLASIITSGKYKESDLYFSAMAPTEKTIFQGEVFRSYRHLSLFYSCLPLTMREGLAKDGKQVYGLEAEMLIKHYLDQRSYEHLMWLLDTYDDHVVELSTYSVNWGTVSGMNTIYWEIRCY